MKYRIIKRTPLYSFTVTKFGTKKDAQDYLSFVLKDYKQAAKRGQKNKNYWSSDREIVVNYGGDRLTYEIVK
jgi:hypothetical protein